MSEANSDPSRADLVTKPSVSFQAIASAMRVADALGYIAVEATTCPHCQHRNIYAHLFNETLTCMACQRPFPSKVPRPPQQGELNAGHLLAALLALHKAARKEQEQLPAMTPEEFATYPEFVQRAMKRYALSEVLKSLEKAKELGIAYADL